jgi:hypothetical protein
MLAASILCKKTLSDAGIKNVVDDVDIDDYVIVNIFVLVVSDIFSRFFGLEFEQVALDAVPDVIDFFDPSVMTSGYVEAIRIFNEPSSQKYLQTLGTRVLRLVNTLEYDHYHEMIQLLEIGREHLAE